MRRIIIIITIILGLAVTGGGVYFFFFASDGNGGGNIESFDDLFSFDSIGKSDDVELDNPSTNEGEQSNNNNEGVDQNIGFGGITPELLKITTREVSGYGLFDISSGSTTVVRYVDTESGNIFEADLNTFNTSRITNTTILQTIDSLWTERDGVVLRYVDENKDIQTFVAEIVLPEESEDSGEILNELNGSFLEKNIEQIDASDRGVFALIENQNGSNGVLYSSDLSSENIVLSTPLKEIDPAWVDNRTIAINTKPSTNSLGYLFLLDTINESFNVVISEVRGLNSNVSKNKDVLYSASESRGVSLWFLDNKNSEVKKIDKMTLAEKCVWNNSEERLVYCAVPKSMNVRDLPDEWYKGNISFSDDIWRINLETEEMEMLFNPESIVGESIDATNMLISESNEYITFVNKKDRTLWAINLLGQ